MSEHIVDLNEESEEFMNSILESGKRNFVGAHELARYFQDSEETFRHNHPEFFTDDFPVKG